MEGIFKLSDLFNSLHFCYRQFIKIDDQFEFSIEFAIKNFDGPRRKFYLSKILKEIKIPVGFNEELGQILSSKK